MTGTGLLLAFPFLAGLICTVVFHHILLLVSSRELSKSLLNEWLSDTSLLHFLKSQANYTLRFTSGWCWIQISIFSTMFCDRKLAQAHQLVFEAEKESHNFLNLSPFLYIWIQVLFTHPQLCFNIQITWALQHSIWPKASLNDLGIIKGRA